MTDEESFDRISRRNIALSICRYLFGAYKEQDVGFVIDCLAQRETIAAEQMRKACAKRIVDATGDYLLGDIIRSLPLPCCARDHDGDGNCDRHPEGLPLPGEER